MLLLNALTALIFTAIGILTYYYLPVEASLGTNLIIIYLAAVVALTLNDYLSELLINYFNRTGS